jgi:DNA-binding TFAR19-related protein (PDSD5 family)
MSDEELEAIKRKKFQELKKRLASKEEKNEQIDANKILGKVFKGRAQEVFNTASYQFPDAMNKIKDALVKLVLSGKLNEIDGEQLFFFLRSLGLRVRLNTEIKFTEHGKLKSLAEKMKDL